MTTALWFTLYVYVFWLLFLAVMALKSCWGGLHVITKILAVPGVLVAFAIDVSFNWSFAIVIFLDRPREATLSQRMGRYKVAGSGWRYWLAIRICGYLLDPFEVGGHCRR